MRTLYNERGHSLSQAADQTFLIGAQRIHHSRDVVQFVWGLIHNHDGHQINKLAASLLCDQPPRTGPAGMLVH